MKKTQNKIIKNSGTTNLLRSKFSIAIQAESIQLKNIVGPSRRQYLPKDLQKHCGKMKVLFLNLRKLLLLTLTNGNSPL